MAAARNVLLVERIDALRDAIVTRLRRAGCRVDAVGDASAAAVLLEQSRFDVIAGDRDVEERLQGRAASFAVIETPLDLEKLVREVGTSSFRAHRTPDLSALERFVASIPTLRDTLAAPMPSLHELALRGEIRRTILDLSLALEAAAEEEPNPTRAAVFTAASCAAADLAGVGRRAVAAAGH